MPKIVPGTERTVPAGKDEPRAPRVKADPQITALMTAFSAQYFQSNELDWRTRTAVKLLLKWYGTVDNVMLAATRAKEIEDQLCRKGQKFTISTVYYYAKYFDKSIGVVEMDEATKQAHTFEKVLIRLRRFVAGYEYYGFRNYARMYEVPRELVLREFGEWYAGLYDTNASEVADYVSENPDNVPTSDIP